MKVFVPIMAAMLAVVVPSTAAQADARVQAQETKGRLSDQEMETLIDQQMTVVRTQGLAAGERQFAKTVDDARIRHGPDSPEVADLLSAFGIGLFIDAKESDDLAFGKASLQYLKAAIGAYKAAFGPKHPEVALALTSYADAEMELIGGEPSSEVEAAREQAFAIRVAALGRAHVETRTSARDLALVKGLPSRVKENPDRLAAAVKLLGSLLADAPDEPFYVSAPFIRIAIARIYALNGKASEALEQANIAKLEAKRLRDFTGCFVFAAELEKVADALRQTGNDDLVDGLNRSNSLAQILQCASEEKTHVPPVASN